jgi:hypothetical protein
VNTVFEASYTELKEVEEERDSALAKIVRLKASKNELIKRCNRAETQRDELRAFVEKIAYPTADFSNMRNIQQEAMAFLALIGN